jgi:hypothetical protein
MNKLKNEESFSHKLPKGSMGSSDWENVSVEIQKKEGHLTYFSGVESKEIKG